MYTGIPDQNVGLNQIHLFFWQLPHLKCLIRYLNQIENLKVNVRLATVDKFADNLKKYDSKSRITATDFLTYNKEHITNYSRVDEKK